MTRPVLAVPGITVTRTFSAAWRDTLAKRGVSVAITEAFWGSRGEIAADIRGLLLERKFRRDAVYAVAEAILMFTDKHRDGLLLTHSAGQAVAFGALRHLAAHGHTLFLDHVSMGGPCFHRAFARPFRMVGLGRPPPGRRVTHLWNPQDSVCCLQALGRWGIVHPTWVDARYTPVAGRDGLLGEHDATDYLDTDQALRALTA